MKEIRTIRMIEQVEIKFVADDGKVFIGENAELDCSVYERQKDHNKIKAKFDRLNAHRIDIPVIDWFCSESEFWKIIINSKEEFYTMSDYFEKVYGIGDNQLIPHENFPHTYNVVTGHDWVEEYNHDIEQELTKALDQLKEG